MPKQKKSNKKLAEELASADSNGDLNEDLVGKDSTDDKSDVKVAINSGSDDEQGSEEEAIKETEKAEQKQGFFNRILGLAEMLHIGTTPAPIIHKEKVVLFSPKAACASVAGIILVCGFSIGQLARYGEISNFTSEFVEFEDLSDLQTKKFGNGIVPAVLKKEGFRASFGFFLGFPTGALEKIPDCNTFLTKEKSSGCPWNGCGFKLEMRLLDGKITNDKYKLACTDAQLGDQTRPVIHIG